MQIYTICVKLHFLNNINSVLKFPIMNEGKKLRAFSIFPINNMRGAHKVILQQTVPVELVHKKKAWLDYNHAFCFFFGAIFI